MQSFQPCWQRIERAKAHRTATVKEWNDFASVEKLYKPVCNVYVDGTAEICVIPLYGSLLTDKFALQIGEMLYQLRGALDACIYEAAIVETGQNPPPHQNKLGFPICGSRNDFLSRAAVMLAPLAQKRRDFIESVQPYNVPMIAAELMVFNFNRTLHILNDWARIDRHRRLHVVGSWASNANPMIRCPAGVTVESLNVSAAGFLEHENRIATFRLSGYRTGMKIETNPDLCLDIALDEPPPPCADNDTLGNRFMAMEVAVRTIVREIKQSF